MGVVPVVNENDTVATEEIRFGDNDRLAALVAHLVHADLLVLLSDVPGVFEGDPRRAEARMLTEVSEQADLAGVRLGRGGGTGVGRGGMASKVEAARVAAAAGTRAVVAAVGDVGAVLAGEPRRHLVHARRRAGCRPGCCGWPTRRRPAGALRLDAGAVQAVVDPPDVAAAGRGDRGGGRLRRR